MNKTIPIALCASAVLLFVGCNEKNSEDAPPPQTEVKGVLSSEFHIQTCTDAADVNPECGAFDSQLQSVAVLSAPEDIGASLYERYNGKRFVVVPKEEKEITPLHMLAYGLYLYAMEAGDDWCGPCRMLAPSSYEEALSMLQEDFNLTGTEAQNRAILFLFNQNLEHLGDTGLDLQEAVFADIKAMAESLVNLTVKGEIPDLSGLEVVEKEGIAQAVRLTDDEMLFAAAPSPIMGLTKDEALQIAYDLHSNKGTLKSYEQAFETLQCQSGETKELFIQGLADNFDANNTEQTHPRPALLSFFNALSPYFHDYDYQASMNNPAIFLETLTQLPSNLTQGRLVIGLKERGYTLSPNYVIYNDVYSIGDDITQAQQRLDGNVSDLRNHWNSVSGNIYYQDLSQLNLASGQSLLDILHGGQSTLDFKFMQTTNVDFIAVAACVPKNTDTAIPVTDVPVHISCDTSIGEQLFQIWGGTEDDFTSPNDSNTPSAVLTAVSNRVTYDENIEKVGNFVDTLSHPGSHISQFEIMINTKSNGSGGALDDRIFAGHVPTLSALVGAIHDPNDANGVNTLNGGMAHFINGSDIAYDLNSNTPVGDLITLLNSNQDDIDIIVSNQTEVDTIRISMCLQKGWVEPPVDTDGDGIPDDDDCDINDPNIWTGCDVNETGLPDTCNTETTLDLRPAATWRDTAGNTPLENNVFSTYPPHPSWANHIWDGEMNWFDFGSQSNAVHALSTSFCACGDTLVVVNELKSDNFSKIYLDDDPTPSSYTNPDYIANRSNGISQSTMASWGPSESGSLYVPHNGNGVDHTLHFDVKNGFGPSGGAVDGNVTFVGHLGACTPEELGGGTTTTEPDTPDHNWTVVYGGTLAVIDHITFNPDPEGPVGPVGTGNVVIDVAGPVITFNAGGHPYPEPNPKPIVVHVAPSLETLQQQDLPAGACYDKIYVGCNAQGDIFTISYDSAIGWTSSVSSAECSGEAGEWIERAIVHHGISYQTVTSPYTGKKWLDRNLGAQEVCTNLLDEACYGDYYQWGRDTDGHEKVTSATTTVEATTINNVGNEFILTVNGDINQDWTNADPSTIQRQAKWNHNDGTSVCPAGFRVPTTAELGAETGNSTEPMLNRDISFNSFLKLPSGGNRGSDDGQVRLHDQGHETGGIWTLEHHVFYYGTSYAYTDPSVIDYGLPVRCIEDCSVHAAN